MTADRRHGRGDRAVALQGSTPRPGPSLLAVLLAARVRLSAATSVVAVGPDSCAAAVTPAEDHLGGRPLIVADSSKDRR